MMTNKQYKQAMLIAYELYYQAMLDSQKWLFEHPAGDLYRNEKRIVRTCNVQRIASRDLRHTKAALKAAYKG